MTIMLNDDFKGRNGWSFFIFILVAMMLYCLMIQSALAESVKDLQVEAVYDVSPGMENYIEPISRERLPYAIGYKFKYNIEAVYDDANKTAIILVNDPGCDKSYVQKVELYFKTTALTGDSIYLYEGKGSNLLDDKVQVRTYYKQAKDTQPSPIAGGKP